MAGIFRVSRAGEAERFNNCGVPHNHRLLWHGTRTANMMGIMQQGLRIAPPESSRSGWSLGKVHQSKDPSKRQRNCPNKYKFNIKVLETKSYKVAPYYCTDSSSSRNVIGSIPKTKQKTKQLNNDLDLKY